MHYLSIYVNVWEWSHPAFGNYKKMKAVLDSVTFFHFSICNFFLYFETICNIWILDRVCICVFSQLGVTWNLFQPWNGLEFSIKAYWFIFFALEVNRKCLCRINILLLILFLRVGRGQFSSAKSNWDLLKIPQNACHIVLALKNCLICYFLLWW